MNKIKTIKLGDRKLEAEYLGRGHYAVAYRATQDGSVLVYVKGDYMKEAIKDINMPHVPRIEWQDDQIDRRGNDITVYRMPYYSKLTACSTQAWQDYKALVRGLEAAHTASQAEYARRMGYDGPNDWRARIGWTLAMYGYEVNALLLKHAHVSRQLKAALRVMADNAANYGSGCTFEFTPRNLGVDNKGRLILRDVLFDAEALEREYAAKRRAKRGRW